MNRREFSRNVLGATLGMSAALPALALAKPKESTPASDPPFPLSVMLWTVFRDLPFEERLEKIAEAGYRHVELVGEFRDWTPDDFAKANRKKRDLGITFDATSGLSHGVGNPGERDAFLRDVESMMVTAEKLRMPGDHRSFGKPRPRVVARCAASELRRRPEERGRPRREEERYAAARKHRPGRKSALLPDVGCRGSSKSSEK